MKLNNSNVIFDQENHTYHLDGVQLKGITSLLSKHLFPDKYNNIPEFILKKAAERGHFIHESCELVDTLGIIPNCEEAGNYAKLKSKYNLCVIANEYIVTDSLHYASPIDVVLEENENEVSLADIKTTSTFYSEDVSWQLSIYAYLFELQNPHLNVKHLYGIYLRGSKHELIEVERKPNYVVEQLLLSDISGEIFTNPYQIAKPDVPIQVYEIEQHMCDLDNEIKKLTEKKDQILSGLLELMSKNNVDNWKGNKIQLIRKKAYIRETLDSKKLKEKHPEIYNDFVKTSNVKESITFKVI
jgi:hypothetical protein